MSIDVSKFSDQPRAAPPFVATDPWATEALEDPLPVQKEVRETAPVVWLSSHGIFATGRYEIVRSVLEDWQHFESGAGIGLMNKRKETPWRPPSIIIEADPPWHDAPRAVLSKVIGPAALRRVTETWAAAAERHIDVLLGDAGVMEIDAVPTLAEAFPLSVFPDAIGLPTEGRHHLLPYSNHSFNTIGPVNDLVRRGECGIAAHSDWVNAQCHRERLTSDGFGADIWAAVDREDLTPAQAPLLVRSLLTAGLDTTVHGISAVLYGLATHPAEWQRLRAHPGLVRRAFDEAVRLQSPVQAFTRTATEDIDLAGTLVRRGQKVLLMFSAANRDPRRWSDPDRYDLTRDPSGHVGFGMGIHQCIGQHVARLEATSLITALLPRVTRLELAGEPRPHLNNSLHGLSSLPLRLHVTR